MDLNWLRVKDDVRLNIFIIESDSWILVHVSLTVAIACIRQEYDLVLVLTHFFNFIESTQFAGDFRPLRFTLTFFNLKFTKLILIYLYIKIRYMVVATQFPSNGELHDVPLI